MTLRPDSPELSDNAASWRSAYVHVPFCRRRCPYCDFTVVTPDEADSAAPGDPQYRYVDALVAEIEMEPEWKPLDSVYVGGGTPSQLDAAALGRILKALENRFGIADGAEVSLEANPEDWSGEVASALLVAGFNRVSFGIQSFDPAVLAALGRSHSPADGVHAIRLASEAGFASINADLIYGTPGETVASWRVSVDEALALDIDHLSTYALTVERGTALGRAVAAGAPAPDPDDQAAKYELACEAATTAGLVRYEVSNFARTGHAVRYNLATWAQGEYVAFGLGAHGHRAGVRRRNLRRLEAYLREVEAGRRPEAGADRIAGREAEVERLLLGLRRAAGVAVGAAGKALVASEEGRRLLAAGVVAVRDDRLAVAKPMLTDAVSRAVLSLSPRDC